MIQMNETVKLRKRQHPLWILYEFCLSIREVIFPIFIVFFFNYQNNALWVKLGSFGLIIYVGYRLLTIIFQWKNHTYLFTDQNIEVFEGRFIATKRYVALNRVQSYQQHTSFFHRLFKLTSLTILTGTSSDNATVKLAMISSDEAERIKALLKEYDLETTMFTLENEQPNQTKKHYQISFQEILLISFTSLYFLAIFPLLLSFYFKIDDIFSLDSFTSKVYTFLTESWAVSGLIALVVILIAIISGIIITYLRFGNYEVTSDHKNIYISKGIVTKTNYTIPKGKINGILIEKAFTRRPFRIVRVKFVRMGELFDEMELETDILFPFINEKRAKKLLP